MLVTTPRSKEELNNILEEYDAFIFGVKDYSVNLINTFTLEEIKEFNRIIKDNNKQIFISLNKNMTNDDIENIQPILKELENIKIDGLLFYDIGIVNLHQKLNLNYDLVWNQEHLVTNYNTINYWYKKGVKYAFLSSEITAKEIKDIIKNTNSKLMITLFGYIPMFTSKRHLVDNYLETFNLKGNPKYIENSDNIYPIIDDKLGTTVYSNYILDGSKEYEDLKDNYIFINNFNIDEKTFSKVSKYIKEKKNLNDLFNNLSTGFLYKPTIYKVKK